MSSIFENIFMANLSRDLLKHPVKNLDIFKKQKIEVNKEPEVSQPLHRKSNLRQLGFTGQSRTHQNLIAQQHKDDSMELPILRLMKSKPSGMLPVTQPSVLSSIMNLFGITDLDQEKPKNLGNTGITLIFSPPHNSYCLKK